MTQHPVPPIAGFDHVHVFVRDRPAAEAWYARVLGLRRVASLAHWSEGAGPLVLADTASHVHLALFERATQDPSHTMPALRVDAEAFRAWRAHLAGTLAKPPSFEDHGQAVSIYFQDPDGNAYEITCWDVEGVR